VVKKIMEGESCLPPSLRLPVYTFFSFSSLLASSAIWVPIEW
jgi:hypothetical protein